MFSPQPKPLVENRHAGAVSGRGDGEALLLECCDQCLQDAEGTIVENSGGVNMQPAGRNGDRATV